MPIVTATGVHKSYGSRVVLESVDLTIVSGERVGIVGNNGTGKSTLARILAGLEPPDQGTVSRRRNATISYLSQSPRFEGTESANDVVLAGLSAWSAANTRYQAASTALLSHPEDYEAHLALQAAAAEEVESLGGWDQSHRVAEILGHLGITRPDTPVTSMSGGEQRRVALARILVATPTLAILDEPTNHLDTRTIDWLEQYLLSEYQGAVMLITHDRYLLDRIATRTVEIAQGQAYAYDGGYEAYLEQKAARLALLARAEQNRQNFLRGELEWLRRQPKARGTKQKARIDRAEAAQRIAAPRPDVTAQFELEVSRVGKTIAELHGLRVELAGRVLVSQLELSVGRGAIIGVVGANGTGKTSLLRTIVGELTPTSGRVVLGKNTVIAYFDQLRTGLVDDKTVSQNVVGDSTRVVIGEQTMDCRAYLERFGFDGIRQRQPVASLSGGERARVSLARLLTQPANLLLMDEPTNDLDVATLGALESMLVDFGATAIIVTHDRWLLDRIATHLVVFEGDGRVVTYVGNYQAYLRLSEERLAEERAQLSAKQLPSTRPARRGAPPTPGAERRLSRPETLELQGLPDRIEAAEQAVAAAEARLADPEVYQGGAPQLMALTEQLAQAKAEVDRLMLRWEELESRQSLQQ